MGNSSELVSAWEALEPLPFPPHPQDDDLSNWLFDLLEADGFYAGVVSSVLSGASPSLPRENELSHLSLRLANLQVADPGDEKILEQCRTYFRAMERVHRALMP